MLALLVAVLGLSTAANHETTQDLVRGFQATGFVVLPPLAAWAVVRCCRVDEARITRAVGSLFLVGLFISVLSVLTAAVPGLFGGVITTYKTEIETGRAFSPLGGPSATAMCLLMVYCLSAGRLQSGRWRILAIAVLAMCFLALLTTLARAALLSFLVANAYLWGRYWRGLGRRVLELAAIGIVILAPLGYGLARLYSLERFSSGLVDGGPSASLALRAESLKAALMYGAKHMALGGGWGLVYPVPREYVVQTSAPRVMYLDGHPTAPKPHSLFALVFAEGGVVALLLLVLLFWQIFRGLHPPDSRSSPAGHALVHGFRAGLLSFVLMCAAQDHLFLSNKIAFFFYLFIFMGLAVSAHYNAQAAPAYGTLPEPAGKMPVPLPGLNPRGQSI